jgi:hypothetical protein
LESLAQLHGVHHLSLKSADIQLDTLKLFNEFVETDNIHLALESHLLGYLI